MKYSASVKDKETGKGLFIENKEYANKADFIFDLRRNGFAVDPIKVKKSDVFDYIVNNTDCSPRDWRMYK